MMTGLSVHDDYVDWRENFTPNSTNTTSSFFIGDIIMKVEDSTMSTRLSREIFKTSTTGKMHFSPIYANALDPNGNRRPDVAWEYGRALLSGAFYHTEGRISKNPDTGLWTRVPVGSREGENDTSCDVNIFDKIKVYSCSVVFDNCNPWLISTNLVHVQGRRKNLSSDVFLQGVTKTESPLATNARYKLCDSSTMKTVHGAVLSDVTMINTNITRGYYELLVNLYEMAAFHELKGTQSSVTVNAFPPRLNNNSITVDSIISCVTNELSFKKGNELKVVPKDRFKTDKCVVKYGRSQDVVFTDSRHTFQRDIMNAVKCCCGWCDRSNVYKPVVGSFKKTVATCDGLCDKYSLHEEKNAIRKALEPLFGNNEVQVHERCLNCSAVMGFKVVGLVEQMCAKIVSTAKVDLALCRITSMMEKSSNGLIPSIMNDFCALLCWKLETRKMSHEKQVEFSKTVLEPFMSKVELSRQNFAQSACWTQSLGRGHKLITSAPRNIVSHKYDNETTNVLFGSVVRHAVGKKRHTSGETIGKKAKRRRRTCTRDTVHDTREDDNNKKFNKRTRRRGGIVYMVNEYERIGARMIRNGLKLPLSSEK